MSHTQSMKDMVRFTVNMKKICIKGHLDNLNIRYFHRVLILYSDFLYEYHEMLQHVIVVFPGPLASVDIYTLIIRFGILIRTQRFFIE
jgi:hypothetical protein